MLLGTMCRSVHGRIELQLSRATLVLLTLNFNRETQRLPIHSVLTYG